MRFIRMILAVMLLAFPLAATATQAQPINPAAAPGHRDLAVGGGYLDTIGGSWIGIQPHFARKPTTDDLKASLGGHLPDDFGLAFSCWVRPAGTLSDCHRTMTVPDSVDGDRLTRTLAPLVKLTKSDAQMASAKEYRLSVHVALTTIAPSGFNAHCYPPFCVANDPPPAPPPQPGAKDPLVAAAIKQANDCFFSKWDHSTELRFAADKAVRENQVQPPSPNVRAAVLDYVNSRTELKRCIADLEKAARDLPVSADDQKAVDSALDFMRSNYDGQTRFELAILIGLLDKDAGEAQLSFVDP